MTERSARKAPQSSARDSQARKRPANKKVGGRRAFWEFLGAAGVAVACFRAGAEFGGGRPSDASASTLGLLPANFQAFASQSDPATGSSALPAWLNDYFRGYLAAEGPEAYSSYYASFVKPYYNWPGGATRALIREEHERYMRAYDVSRLRLIAIVANSDPGDLDAGIHKFRVTCNRERKHRGRDDLAQEVVEIDVTLDLEPRPPIIVGVETVQ